MGKKRVKRKYFSTMQFHFWTRTQKKKKEEKHALVLMKEKYDEKFTRFMLTTEEKPRNFNFHKKKNYEKSIVE
jgi:hypothetical protein